MDQKKFVSCAVCDKSVPSKSDEYGVKTMQHGVVNDSLEAATCPGSNQPPKPSVLVLYANYWGVGVDEKEATRFACVAGARRGADRAILHIWGGIPTGTIFVDQLGRIGWEGVSMSHVREASPTGQSIVAGWMVEDGKRRKLQPHEL